MNYNDIIEFQAGVIVGSKSRDGDDTLEDGEILKTRTYDLHITYDKYYQTPRLFFTGYDEVCPFFKIFLCF